MAEYTIEALFCEIDGKTYDSYRDLEQDVILHFNQHLHDFPPHYTYRDAITWADRKRWLRPHNGGFVVKVKAVA